MHFFMKMHPPTVTAQEHKISVKNNKPVFYEPPKLVEAKNIFISSLAPHKPQKKPQGAVFLYCLWLFPKGKHKNGEWKTTKPDTDNLQKLLKDCMTKVGFWNDDAQVARELVEKRYSDEPCGIYIEITELKGENAE